MLDASFISLSLTTRTWDLNQHLLLLLMMLLLLQEHCPPAAYDVPCGASAVWVHARSGFVQEHHCRLTKEGYGHRQLALLAARQLGRQAVQLVQQTNLGQQRQCNERTPQH
jgi:hypothetical protein